MCVAATSSAVVLSTVTGGGTRTIASTRPSSPLTGRCWVRFVRPCAVCGNQQCELGEQCTTLQCTGGGQCAADCPLQTLDCGDGCGHTGRCLPSTGTCECFTGYVGSNCSSCDRGYVMIGSTCVFLPGALVSCSDGVRYAVGST